MTLAPARRFAAVLAAVVLASAAVSACGPASNGSPASGTGGTVAYAPPQGAGTAAQDQDSKPFALGKMLQATVKVASLHLPAATASGSVAFKATGVATDPNADPALTDPEWKKAGGFCLKATDGTFTGYPDTTTPDAAGYETCGYALWSAAHLWVALVVSDPHPNYFVSDTAWEDAAVETYFGVDGQNTQWMNDLGVTSSGTKVGPVTSIPGAQLTAALTDKGYILVLGIPWSALNVTPKKGVAIPFNIQTDAPNADGSSDFFYYANGTKPAGADVSTLGSLTLG